MQYNDRPLLLPVDASSSRCLSVVCVVLDALFLVRTFETQVVHHDYASRQSSAWWSLARKEGVIGSRPKMDAY